MVEWVWLLAGLIGLQRVIELRLAQENRRWLVAQGAKEYGSDHYPAFFLLHGGWLLGWIIETEIRGLGLSTYWYLWLAAFGLAQGLRYWCIASLGRYWNTRVLVVPGAKVIRRGPYQYITHPNYLAVAMELFSVPLIFDAWFTATVATLCNVMLLLGIRIPVENKALQQLTK